MDNDKSVHSIKSVGLKLKVYLAVQCWLTAYAWLKTPGFRHELFVGGGGGSNW